MPLAITHFKFTELPDPNAIDSLINAVPIVVDTLYPIANQNLVTFERNVVFDNKALQTFAKYKVHDSTEVLDSNEALVGLLWTGIAANPASANYTAFIINSATVNLLNVLPLNDVTEFIEITGMVGVPNLKLNGVTTYIGQQLTLLDLLYSVFTANSQGGGDPYFQLSYKVGRGVTLEATVYTMDLDIVSLAIITLDMGPYLNNYLDTFDVPPPTDYNVTEEFSGILVSLGYAYATANVTIIINSAFLGMNAWNSVTIEVNGVETEYFGNTTFSQAVVLDQYGLGLINVNNYVVKDTGGPWAGDITLTLDDIDGNPALVNGVQTYQILTNIV
jgi:hypothetical protein